MADRTFDILIDIQARVAAIDDATRKIQNLNAETKGVGAAFEGVLKGIQLGLGIDVVNLVGQIPEKLREAVAEGIRFNAFVEQATIGVAGMLRQFEPERYRSFNAALGDSSQLIDLLRSKANQLGLSFEAVVETYKVTAGALFAGGVTNLQKQVDLTVLLTQAVGALGITGFQAQRDIFDLLEGRANRTIAGKALGISDDDVAKAKEAGQLYEFLTTKFAALSESGKVLGTTLQASEQRAKNLAEQLAGIATQEVFGKLKTGLDALNTSLAAPQTAELFAGVAHVAVGTFEELGHVISTVGGELQKVFYLSQQFYGLLGRISQAAFPAADTPGIFDAGAAREFLAVSKQVETSVLSQITNAHSENEELRARQALDAAILAAQQRVSESTGQTHDFAVKLVHDLENMKAVFPAIVGSAKATEAAIEGASTALAKLNAGIFDKHLEITGNDELLAQSKANEAAAAAREAAIADKATPAQADAIAAAAAKNVTDEYQKQADLKKQNYSLTQQENNALDLRSRGLTASADAEKRTADITRLTAQYLKEGAANEEDARAEATKNVDANNRLAQSKGDQKASTEGERDARKEITDLLREDSALLHGLQSEQRLIQQNPFLGAGEKDSLLHDNAIAQQEQLVLATQKTQEALDKAYGSGSQADITQLGQRLEDLKTRSVELGYAIQTTSFTGGLRAELTRLDSSLELTGKKIGQVFSGAFSSAIGGVSAGITGLITQSSTFAQAWNSAIGSIIGQFVQLGVETAVYYGKLLIHWAIARGAASANRAADVTEHVAAETTKSGASFLSALLTSISSYGYAAVIGLAAVVAAIAYFATSGFEAGGYTGDGAPGAIAGVVHRGEYVVPADVTSSIGVERLNNMTVAARLGGGFAAGGFAGDGGSSSSGSLGGIVGKPEVYVYFDEREMQKRLLESNATEKQVIHIMGRAGVRRT